MPAFGLNDPRLPRNRCHLLWASAERAGLVGQPLPVATVKTMIQLVANVAATRQVKDYQEMLANFQMFDWDKEAHTMTPRPDGLRLLQ